MWKGKEKGCHARSLPGGHIPQDAVRLYHKGLSPPLRSRLKANSSRLRANSVTLGLVEAVQIQSTTFSQWEELLTVVHAMVLIAPSGRVAFECVTLQSVRWLMDLIQVPWV